MQAIGALDRPTSAHQGELKGTDPVRGDAVRYANLSHPGDEYSYDIFSQAGQARRGNHQD